MGNESEKSSEKKKVKNVSAIKCVHKKKHSNR